MPKIQFGLALAALMMVLPLTTQAQSNVLKGTVVLRVDSRDGSQATVSVNTPPASEAQAQALAQDNSKFSSVPNDGRSELDRDGGAPSYYFYRPPYNTYAYGNYGYSPYAITPYRTSPYAYGYGSYAVNPYATYNYNPYYYSPTVVPSAVYPAYSYYGATYSPYYVYNSSPYTYYYYGYGW